MNDLIDQKSQNKTDDHFFVQRKKIMG